MPTKPAITDPAPHPVLDRPADQRRREYKYRLGQSLVFGLPVLALEAFGYQLGGADSQRWVPILQAVLTGWITYVAATGPLFESLLLLTRRKITADLFIAPAAIALYLLSIAAILLYLLNPHHPNHPHFFHYVVIILATRAAIGAWATHPPQNPLSQNPLSETRP